MNILVCYKVTVDYDKVSSKEILRRDFSYAKKNFGFFDEGALELALRYKDEYDCTLTALTYGEEDEITIKRLYAVGYDKVTIIPGVDNLFSPIHTAKTLGEYIRKGNYDLILCGDAATPNESGSVPYHLGEYLGYKVISDVTYFDKTNIYSSTDIKDTKYDMRSGLILVVSNSKYPYLRFSKYQDQLKTKDKKADILEKVEYSFKGKVKPKEILKKDVKEISLEGLLEEIREVAND